MVANWIPLAAIFANVSCDGLLAMMFSALTCKHQITPKLAKEKTGNEPVRCQ